jgi:hypothetical protein
VSQLGDLLEVVHNSRRSFRTFRGRYRLWRDERLAQEAFLAAAEAAKARGGSSVAIISTGPGDEPAPAFSESEWRIWLQRPDRVREEFDDEGFGCPLAVRVGSRQSLVVVRSLERRDHKRGRGGGGERRW